MNLGRAIRWARKQRGWSQSKLAERAGVSINHLCRVERNQVQPRADILDRLAKGLGLPLPLLLALSCSPGEWGVGLRLQVEVLHAAKMKLIVMGYEPEGLEHEA